MRLLDGIMDSMGMSLGKLRELVLTGRLGVLWSMGELYKGITWDHKELDMTEH